MHQLLRSSLGRSAAGLQQPIDGLIILAAHIYAECCSSALTQKYDGGWQLSAASLHVDSSLNQTPHGTSCHYSEDMRKHPVPVSRSSNSSSTWKSQGT